MNDRCPMCDAGWEQGDKAVVIGWVNRNMQSSLRFVHRDCLLREVVGEDETKRIIAWERGMN